MKKTWKAAIYLRLSKDDGSSGESSSIKNQREIIKDFLAKNIDISIVSERIDDGVSGVSFDRPSFNAMIDDVRDGVIDCVIVKDLSRFGRDHLDAGNYIQNIFPFFKVRFIAVTDGIDTNNKKVETDNILIPIKNIVNANYSRELSIKSKSSLDIKRKKGDFVGPFAVYGYKKSALNKNQLVVDENVADYIRDIFKLKLSGMSADKIAEKFNEIGILPPSEYKKMCGTNYSLNFDTTDKPKWHAKAVIRILQNPVYIGVLEQGKLGKVNFKIQKRVKRDKKDWIIVENAHEPIIEPFMFENVQRALRLDTRTSPMQENVYIFSGLLFCGECGANIKRKTISSKGKKYNYYSCVNCKEKNIKEVKLIDSVTQTVKSFIDSYTNAEKIVEQIEKNDFMGIKIKKLNEHSNNLKNELETVQGYKLSLYEKYIDGVIKEVDYQNFYAMYNKNEDSIRLNIEKVRKEIELIKSNDNKSIKEINSFREYKNIETLSRSMVIELIESIHIVGSKEICVQLRHKDEFNQLLSLIELSEVM